ncbi:hypothetical protein GCM10009839_14390 [Catenulispora yoronensis]|uniref:Uncharacterized protein n=1 Tax=Catenulispora yoronensis TaxID=450799 RepID=A0ABN2TT09_9ACTN
MTRQLAAHVAAAIAYELDGWEARPSGVGFHGWFELLGPAGDIVQLRVGEHRIEALGIHEQDLGRTRAWDVAGYRHARIRFSAAKGPARMAGEIRRRLLPTVAENNRILDAAAAWISAAAAVDDAVFAAVKDLFANLHWRDPGSSRREEAASWGSGGGISVEFRLDAYQHDCRSSLTINNLTRVELLALARAAARLRTSATAPHSRSQPSARRHARTRRRRARARETRRTHSR